MEIGKSLVSWERHPRHEWMVRISSSHLLWGACRGWIRESQCLCVVLPLFFGSVRAPTLNWSCGIPEICWWLKYQTTGDSSMFGETLFDTVIPRKSQNDSVYPFHPLGELPFITPNRVLNWHHTLVHKAHEAVRQCSIYIYIIYI